MTDWRENIVDDEKGLRHLLAETHRIAVLGIRSEDFVYRPAHFVAAYLVDAGFEVIPVPVYEPEVTMILDRPVYRNLRDVPGQIDMVNIFRRAEDLASHLEELLETKPNSVWLQLGTSNGQFAEQLARAGIKVVQDRCLMVDHRRLIAH